MSAVNKWGLATYPGPATAVRRPPPPPIGGEILPVRLVHSAMIHTLAAAPTAADAAAPVS
jgi:hypothetical protein